MNSNLGFGIPGAVKLEAKVTRDKLLFILDNLGTHDFKTNKMLVPQTERDFLIETIKSDLAIPDRVPIWVFWFENGSVFSEATDTYGNMSFNVELGNDRIEASVSYDKKQKRFLSLYIDNTEIPFSEIQEFF